MRLVGEMLDFAISRDAMVDAAEERLAPLVERWLEDPGSRMRMNLVVAEAAEIWTGNFEDIAPSGVTTVPKEAFIAMMRESLSKTSAPATPPEPEQILRVTEWTALAAVNDSTYEASRTIGTPQMRWTSMKDDRVRPTHTHADGQIQRLGQTFAVGEAELRYPGDPLGPLEETMNCRCLAVPVRRESIVAAASEVLDDDDLVEAEIEGEDLVDDLVVEIPIHGVAAPEGVPTGDGRQFALGSLSHRDLPLPIAYQTMTGESGHSNAVTVGRIDDMWREDSGEYRYRGVIITTKPHANEVIDGIVDGTGRGVSVDVDDIEVELPAHPDEKDGDALDAVLDMMNPPVQVFSKARVAGITIVSIPAYQEAYIALGEAFEDELSDEDKAVLASCGCFGHEEDEEDDEPYELGYDAFVEDEYREVGAKERKNLAKKGEALPDGSFPIANLQDLKNAIQAIGRAKDPAKAKAHIKKRARALGHADLIPDGWALEPDALVAAAGTKDGPGWITNPRATARIRRYWTVGKGAGKIRWGVPGDFNRCRRQLAKYVRNPDWLAGTCANMHKEAIGLWPGMERGGRHATDSAQMISLVASAAVEVPAEFFDDPHLTGPTPIDVDLETRQVRGHLAVWGVCHLNPALTQNGVCSTAPHSATNYAYFRLGAAHTSEGKIPVGHITMDTGHAGDRWTAQRSLAHYDNTGTIVADVAAGEDEYGIWIAGAMRPDVTEEQMRAFAAVPVSGDWRRIGNNLELIAALAVPAPGFAIPRVSLAASAGEGQISLIGAGALPAVSGANAMVASANAPLTPDLIAAISRNAIAEFRHQEKRDEQLKPVYAIRQRLRSERIAQLRAKVPVEGE